MWDTASTTTTATDALHLSHDLPCLQCGHPPHTYLPCSDGCDCQPVRRHAA